MVELALEHEREIEVGRDLMRVGIYKGIGKERRRRNPGCALRKGGEIETSALDEC